VFNQWSTRKRVKHLGEIGAHPAPLPGSQDDYFQHEKAHSGRVRTLIIANSVRFASH